MAQRVDSLMISGAGTGPILPLTLIDTRPATGAISRPALGIWNESLERAVPCQTGRQLPTVIGTTGESRGRTAPSLNPLRCNRFGR